MTRKVLARWIVLSVVIGACRGATEDAAPPQAAAPSPKAAMAQMDQTGDYNLVVSFAGLIAFAEAKLDEKPVIWALLPNADYKGAPGDKELPPCVNDEGHTAKFIADQFPPHLAALRFTNAKVLVGGVLQPLDTPVFIHGQDLRFDTHKKIGSLNPLTLPARARHLVDTLGGQLSDYEALDKVNPLLIGPDSSQVMAQPFLGARALINFGDSVVDAPLQCAFGPIDYGFEANASAHCSTKTTHLGEEVKVTQNTLNQPVTITLQPSGTVLTIGPATTGQAVPVTIEVLNVIEPALKPGYDPCDDKHQHQQSYRWFYRLLDQRTLKPSCPDHFFPCAPEKGGSKCPQKGFGG